MESLEGPMENKLPSIKFSHYYSKFKKPETDYLDFVNFIKIKARILQIFKIHFNDLNERFIDYDCHIPYTNEYYDLPKADLIVILLEAGFNRVLTTIRRFTPQKWDYYKSIEGQEVNLVLVKK